MACMHAIIDVVRSVHDAALTSEWYSTALQVAAWSSISAAFSIDLAMSRDECKGFTHKCRPSIERIVRTQCCIAGLYEARRATLRQNVPWTTMRATRDYQ